MTKPSTKAEFNNFVKGLITEASPLNFPENASFKEENFELDRNGTRARRLGIDIESGGVYRTLNYMQGDSLPSSFKWSDAGGNADTDIEVVQDGNILNFFNLSTASLSSDGYISSLTLHKFSPSSTYSFTSVDGRLVVVTGSSEFAIVEYKNLTFSVEYARLKTRDVWGIPTGIPEYDEDPSYRGPFNINHYYNLQNQSWGIPRKNSEGNLIDPVTEYSKKLFKYPSNSETVWPGLQYQPVEGGEPFERLYPNLFEEVLGRDTKAGRGYFIIDVLERGPSRLEAFTSNRNKYPPLALITGVPSFNSDTTVGGPTVVAEFAGRVFYAGFGGIVTDPTSLSPTLSNHIFFSQLVKSKSDYTKCYQSGDPSARDNSDIIDTDGGFIKVSGAEKIIGMQVIGHQLIVIANNGVWAIVGGSDYGFTATNYRVDKLTSFGCIAPKSIISDGSQVFYWADDGIYLIRQSETGTVASSLTETTIQSYYRSLDNRYKQSTSGVYDTISKKARWIYRTGPVFDTSTVTYELILDLVLGSFYLYRLYGSKGYIVEGLDTAKFINTYVQTSVTSGSSDVVVNTDQVTVSSIVKEQAPRNLRYLFLEDVNGSIKYSFAEYNNTSFKDWNTHDAKAFLLTGSMTAGDSTAKKQVPYLLTMLRRTETGVNESGVFLKQSSCKMRFQWDWSTLSISNRWSNEQQVYRINRVAFNDFSEPSTITGDEVIVTKTKIRGKGRSFAVYFESEEGKDCKLLGWNISLNAVPIT